MRLESAQRAQTFAKAKMSRGIVSFAEGGGDFFTRGNIRDTVVGKRCRKHKFHGNISSSGLTLKRAPKSRRIAPLDRTHTTSY